MPRLRFREQALVGLHVFCLWFRLFALHQLSLDTIAAALAPARLGLRLISIRVAIHAETSEFRKPIDLRPSEIGAGNCRAATSR
jgi:hypothetical protein